MDEYNETRSPEENNARGLFAIAAAIEHVAVELHDLHAGGPGATMGALGFAGLQVKEGLESMATAITSLRASVDTAATALEKQAIILEAFVAMSTPDPGPSEH